MDKIKQANKWLEETTDRYFEIEINVRGESRKVFTKLCADKKHMICVWIHSNEKNPRCSIEMYPVEPLSLMYGKIIQKSFWNDQFNYVKNMCS